MAKKKPARDSKRGGPLSNVEKFFIKGNMESMPIQDMCRELKRNQPIVKEYMAEIKEAEVEEYNLASQIQSSNGATVMTQNGSELSDALKRNIRSGIRPDCVTSIKKK